MASKSRGKGLGGRWSVCLGIGGQYASEQVVSMARNIQLESEVSQYKRIVAEQTLQITVLKDVIEKKL